MNKYLNVKTEVDGIWFSSKKEAKRYSELKLLEKAGDISHLELQPKFKLVVNGKPLRSESGRQVTYIGDFAYFSAEKNCRVVEDVKSTATKTPVYKLKKCLVEAIFPAVKIVEI